MNTVTTLGIDLVNKGRQSQVEQDAAYLVNCILNEQKGIKLSEESIKLEQEALAKIANDVVTQKAVLGTEWTGQLNINQTTILKAIETINRSKQSQVELTSQTHINRVLQHKSSIEQRNKAIAELREKLTKLSVDVVTPAQVVG